MVIDKYNLLYNPFGFSPSDERVEYSKKKLIRKKRTMASIHQYKALSDISTVAKAKSPTELESIDKELHEHGVRPGQVWKLLHGTNVYFLSFIGYHQKGFLMMNLRAQEDSPIPSISLFKYPKKLKIDLLQQIKSNSAIMLSSVTPILIDKKGEAREGRELDVTLAGLMVRPAFWHDHNKNRNYFLSICGHGHCRASIGYLPSGYICMYAFEYRKINKLQIRRLQT